MTESRDASARAIGRALAHRYLAEGDPLGWFEALYARADGDPSIISWADLTPNPNLAEWLERDELRGEGKTALVVGCGLGDDAEWLARRGLQVVAFDISGTAIHWCRRRFPESRVQYVVADLFDPPPSWLGAFDLILESYTLQVLPPALRRSATAAIAGFVQSGGTLLAISRGREPEEPEGQMPWPLTRDELRAFQDYGLKEVSFEDYGDREQPPVRRFRVTYQKS